MYGKIVNGKLVTPPVNSGNKFNVYKDKEWLEANGFHELTTEDFAKIERKKAVRKYSKLRIIEVLGEAWPTWKAKIDAAGMTDYWNACTYLASDHPAFAQFFKQLSTEERQMLNKNCIWTND